MNRFEHNFLFILVTVYNYYYDKKTYRETYYGLNLLENLLKKDKLIIDYKSKSIVNNGITPIFKLLYEFVYKLDSKISFNKFIFKHIEDNIDFSIKNKYGFNVLEEIISLSHRYNQKNSNKNLSTYINYIVNIAYKNGVSLNLSSDFEKNINNHLIRDYLYKNDELNSKSLIYKYLLDIDKMDWNNINSNANLLDYIPDFNLFSNDELKLIADNYKSYNIDLYMLFKDNDLLNENLQDYIDFYKYLIESNLIDINHTLEDKKTNYFISPLHKILNDMIFKFSFDVDLLEKLIKNNPDFSKTNENGENIFSLLSESVNKDFNMEAFNQYEKIVKFFHEKNINLYLNNQNKKNKKSAISCIFNGDIFYKSEPVYSKQNKGYYYKKTDNIFYLSIENSIGNIDIDFDLFLTNNVFNEEFAKLIFKRINDFNKTEDEIFSFFKKNIDRTAFTPIITRKHLPTGTIKFEMRKKNDTILNYYQNLDSTFNILFNYLKENNLFEKVSSNLPLKSKIKLTEILSYLNLLDLDIFNEIYNLKESNKIISNDDLQKIFLLAFNSNLIDNLSFSKMILNHLPKSRFIITQAFLQNRKSDNIFKELTDNELEFVNHNINNFYYKNDLIDLLKNGLFNILNDKEYNLLIKNNITENDIIVSSVKEEFFNHYLLKNIDNMTKDNLKFIRTNLSSDKKSNFIKKILDLIIYEDDTNNLKKIILKDFSFSKMKNEVNQMILNNNFYYDNKEFFTDYLLNKLKEIEMKAFPKPKNNTKKIKI